MIISDFSGSWVLGGRFRLHLALDHVRAGVDRDLPGLLRLRNLAHEVDVQEAILQSRALHLDEIGKLEDALKGARRDAPIKGLAGFLLGLGLLLAADGEGVLLELDIELRLAETRDRNGDAVGILAGPLD